MAILFVAGLLSYGGQPVTRLYTTEDGLVRNSVSVIRKDSRGRLWFCTGDGLSLFDGEKFANYTGADGAPFRSVADILDAGGGFYWLATRSGLYRFRPRTAASPVAFEPVPLAIPGASANVLLRDRTGQVWCGTSQGIERIVEGSKPHGEQVRLDIPGEVSQPHYVMALAQDPSGDLWIGTGAGLLRYGSGGATRFRDTCTDVMVRDLLVDRAGELWVGYRNGSSRASQSPDSGAGRGCGRPDLHCHRSWYRLLRSRLRPHFATVRRRRTSPG